MAEPLDLAAPARRVTVDAHQPVVREQLAERGLQPLRALAHGVELAAALRAALRRRPAGAAARGAGGPQPGGETLMEDEMGQPPKTQMANLFVNERGFVYADGAKICRLTPEGGLEFLHKGHRNSRKRGSVVVVKPAAQVQTIILWPYRAEGRLPSIRAQTLPAPIRGN